MKGIISIALTFALLVTDVSAFSPNPPVPTAKAFRLSFKTLLKYNIVTPPDEDNCEVDGSDCEESVFDRKRRERAEADASMAQKFADNGLDMYAIDRAESVDQYQNAAGSGIIPGMSLSALCEDD